MKAKDLIEKLQKYPEDMEVLINYDGIYDGEITVNRKDLYHCNCTSKWQSNFNFYTKYDEPYVYKDEVDGKIVVVKIPTEKKEFIVLDC
jgi:hypothetical protein